MQSMQPEEFQATALRDWIAFARCSIVYSWIHLAAFA